MPKIAAWRRRADDRRIVFLHVPRTAGTTVKAILARLYDPSETVELGVRAQDALDQLKQLPSADRARIKVLQGHTYYGAHDLLLPPTTYMTVLRDPVERVVSFYYFVARHPHHYHFPFVWQAATSPAAYATSGQTIATDNFMVRQISGAGETVPFGQLGSEHLELAKEHLEADFAVAGLQERFDETLLLCAAEFGWRNLFYVPLNATTDRPAAAQLDSGEHDAIAELNHLDVELYRFVASRFDERVKAAGRLFGLASHAFRQINPLAARRLELARDAEERGLGRTPVSRAAPLTKRLRTVRRLPHGIPAGRPQPQQSTYGPLSEPGDEAALAYALWRYVPGMRWVVLAEGGSLAARLRDAGVDATDVEDDKRGRSRAGEPDRSQLASKHASLPYGDGQIDTVVAIGALARLDDVEGISLLAELRRVCNLFVVATVASWVSVDRLLGLVRSERRDYYRQLGEAYEGPLPPSDLVASESPDAGSYAGWRTVAASSWWQRQVEAAGWARIGALEDRLTQSVHSAALADESLWVLGASDVPIPAASLRPLPQTKTLAERWGLPLDRREAPERETGVASPPR